MEGETLSLVILVATCAENNFKDLILKTFQHFYFLIQFEEKGCI